MTNWSWPDNREIYMGVHMCNSLNYPDEDPNRDRSFYNVIFCCDFLLITVKVVKFGEELLVGSNYSCELQLTSNEYLF